MSSEASIQITVDDKGEYKLVILGKSETPAVEIAEDIMDAAYANTNGIYDHYTQLSAH